AAYRFARHEPGVDVVLFGTGDAGHLRANVESLLKPPLPEADRQKLAALFGHLAIGIGLDSQQAATRQPYGYAADAVCAARSTSRRKASAVSAHRSGATAAGW